MGVEKITAPSSAWRTAGRILHMQLPACLARTRHSNEVLLMNIGWPTLSWRRLVNSENSLCLSPPSFCFLFLVAENYSLRYTSLGILAGSSFLISTYQPGTLLVAKRFTQNFVRLLPLMKPYKVWGGTFGYQKRYRLVCWDGMRYSLRNPRFLPQCFVTTVIASRISCRLLFRCSFASHYTLFLLNLKIIFLWTHFILVLQDQISFSSFLFSFFKISLLYYFFFLPDFSSSLWSSRSVISDISNHLALFLLILIIIFSTDKFYFFMLFLFHFF